MTHHRKLSVTQKRDHWAVKLIIALANGHMTPEQVRAGAVDLQRAYNNPEYHHLLKPGLV